MELSCEDGVDEKESLHQGIGEQQKNNGGKKHQGYLISKWTDVMLKNNCGKKTHEATETMELACEDGVDGK
jgi:hypothetical protein